MSEDTTKRLAVLEVAIRHCIEELEVENNNPKLVLEKQTSMRRTWGRYIYADVCTSIAAGIVSGITANSYTQVYVVAIILTLIGFVYTRLTDYSCK